MTVCDAIKAYAGSVNEHRDELFFSLIAEDCVYFSRGRERARGKEAICAILHDISDHWEDTYIHVWPAEITESGNASYAAGEPCAVVAMKDEYSCAGFFTMALNEAGRVGTMDFSVDPSVRFRVDGAEETGFSHTHFPKDAADALCIRAEGTGVFAPDDRLGLHYVETDVGVDLTKDLCNYIEQYVFEDFNNKMFNAAAYMFAMGMAYDFYRRTGVLLFRFYAPAADEGTVPKVPDKYAAWIRDGYDTGKDLFTAYLEYKANRGNDGTDYDSELRKTFITLFNMGTIKADRDIDRGLLNTELEDTIAPRLARVGPDGTMLESKGPLDFIPEILSISSEVAAEMYAKLKEFGESRQYTYENIIRNTLVFCAYAGIGAVLLWKENGEELPGGNIVEILCRPRGLYYMDEHVHDKMGMPYETEEAKELTRHLFLLRDILMEVFRRGGFDPIEMNENFKAMYDYGMLWAMEHLGIRHHAGGTGE